MNFIQAKGEKGVIGANGLENSPFFTQGAGE